MYDNVVVICCNTYCGKYERCNLVLLIINTSCLSEITKHAHKIDGLANHTSNIEYE